MQKQRPAPVHHGRAPAAEVGQGGKQLARDAGDLLLARPPAVLGQLRQRPALRKLLQGPITCSCIGHLHLQGFGVLEVHSSCHTA